MFEGLMGKKFLSKCKSSIKQIITRVEMVRKRRKAMQNFLMNDIADLLREGYDSNAYTKAEGIWADLNQLACYDFIDQFCGWISEHLSVMNKERECPKECREAVASLIFAAARMADVPELRELRNILTGRYGNSLESFANQEFAEKLKSKSSTKDAKLQLLRDIAQECSIEWDSKALEQRLFNPPAIEQDQKRKVSSNDASGDRHKSSEKEAGKRDEDEARSKQNNVNGDISPKEDEGEKNRDANGYRLYGSRRDAIPRKEGRDYRSGEAPESVPRKDDEDGNGHLEKEMDNKNQNPFYNGAVPPPYSRPKGGKYETGGSDGNGVSMDLPIQSKDGGEGKNQQNDPVTEAKQKPKSVRRRHMKQPQGHDEGHSTVKTNPSRMRVTDTRKGLQISQADVHDQKEEEEIDRLLIHYSTKKPSREQPKELPPSQQNATDNSESTEKRSIGSKDHKSTSPAPSRAKSFPAEATSPTETRKWHARATSFQPDMTKPGHVHPKLPDYDDIAASLAALRRN